MLKREHKVSNISSEAIFAIPAMKPSRVIYAIIFCICLIISDIKYDTSSFMRSYSKEIIRPIIFIMGIPSDILEYSSTFFSNRYSLDEEIQKLRKENLKLKTANQYTQKLSLDVNRLNKLWSATSVNKERLIISKKSYLSSNVYQPLLVIDISKTDEIRSNNAVLSEEGLVGRVKNIGISSAEVMLVQDIRSSIPIISGDSSLHATLQGKGLDRMGELNYIKKTAKFYEGEDIFTSGLGEIFPEGLKVGEIVSISDSADSEFLKIEVSFSSNPVNSDYFLIQKDE